MRATPLVEMTGGVSTKNKYVRKANLVRRNGIYLRIITVSSKVSLRRKTKFVAQASSLEVNCPDYIIEGL